MSLYLHFFQSVNSNYVCQLLLGKVQSLQRKGGEKDLLCKAHSIKGYVMSESKIEWPPELIFSLCINLS